MSTKCHTKSIVRTRCGFTLLEVMIALAVLSIGLLGLSAMQMVAVKGTAFSSEMTYASMLAQQKLEELKNCDYYSLNPGTHSEAQTDGRGFTYALDWTVTPHESLTMKTVVLDVSWQSLRLGDAGQTASQRTVTSRFTTYICP